MADKQTLLLHKKTNGENKPKTEDLSATAYLDAYLGGALSVIFQLSKSEILKSIKLLADLKKTRGRLFLLGVGGAAANCSHAVNDFRKIANIEAYAPVDNVSELTARTNDDGWHTVFVNWLKVSRLSSSDILMILSVGGGNLEKNISPNIVEALKYAKQVNAGVIGIVSRDGGYTKIVADVCIRVPVINNDFITPYAESFQALIWHLIVFSPQLRAIKPY